MSDQAKYVFQNYGHLMNERERLAYKHISTTLKSKNADEGVAKMLRRSLSSDPELLELAAEGYDSFVIRTAQRIMSDHPNEVFLNSCSKCKALARTPRARQCRACGYDWHEPEGTA